ncbi:MAG: hypothetical protein QXQ64_06680 [Candidatus Bathyarchaeia archaeon]
MPISQLEKTLTALAGEFAVASRLCLKGYVASLTLKNFPKADIFCFNPKNGKQVVIQVKTKKGGRNYYVPEDVDKLSSIFVFVYINEDEKMDFFIAPSKEVAEISEKERQEYIAKHPNVSKKQPRMISTQALQKFKDRWDLLGIE